MLSKLTRLYLNFAGNLIWSGGGAPCRFTNCLGSSLPKVVETGRSPFRIVFEQVHKLVDRFYIIFVAYRLISLASQNAPLSVIMKTSYILTCYTVSAVLDFQTDLKQSLPHHFVREYTQYFVDFENKYLASKRGARIKCNKFLSTLCAFGIVIYVQNFFLLRKNPMTPHFLTSLLTDQDRKGFRIPLVVAQYWVWYNFVGNVYFYIFPIYVYTCCAIRLVQELK